MGEGIVRQLHFFYFYFLSVQLWLSSLQKSVLYIVTGWPYSLDGGNMNDCFHSAIHCLEWMILVNSPLPLMANVLLLPSSALLVWFLEFSLVQVSGSTDLMLLGLPFFFNGQKLYCCSIESNLHQITDVCKRWAQTNFTCHLKGRDILGELRSIAPRDICSDLSCCRKRITQWARCSG